MKQQLVLLSICLLAFMACKKKECDEGYLGSDCDQQITPQNITITKIEVIRFPATDNGGGWDLTSGPEIYPEILKGNIRLWSSSSYYENANPNIDYEFEVPSSVNFSEPKDEYSIRLYDYDGSSLDDFMGGISFTPYSSSNNFPSVITVDDNGAVAFRVHVSYSF